MENQVQKQNVHYCAFISYRHVSPDQEIAARLHRLIERYTVPKALRGSEGQRHPGRVFRDQEELPLSADLGKDIETALDHSDYLICICTPRYLECSLFKISRAIKSFSGLWFALGSSLTS